MAYQYTVSSQLSHGRRGKKREDKGCSRNVVRRLAIIEAKKERLNARMVLYTFSCNCFAQALHIRCLCRLSSSLARTTNILPSFSQAYEIFPLCNAYSFHRSRKKERTFVFTRCRIDTPPWQIATCCNTFSSAFISNSS